jgi:peptide-methionine (S)-S-oxide reductase
MTTSSKTTDSIILAGGCFWCLEAIFKRLQGVTSVISGYTGGTVANPSYTEVCSGSTGHAEAVQITYDTTNISLQELLDIFWKFHDPTTLNQQGADMGTQYRSAIFYSNEQQRQIAFDSKHDLEQSAMYPDPIVTEITKLDIFYPAEQKHQNYYDQNKNQGYCRLVIDPKIEKLFKDYNDKLQK